MANPWLLNDVLRKEWGFKGAVVSDYFAIREMITRHKMFATSRMRQSAQSIRVSIPKLPDGEAYVASAGTGSFRPVRLQLVDEAVRRMLRLKFEAGLFENPYADSASALSEEATAGRRIRVGPGSRTAIDRPAEE